MVIPAIYTSRVRHIRKEPVANDFTYTSTTWLVDVDDLPVLPWYLRPLARWRAADHIGDPLGTLRSNVEAQLAAHGLVGAIGQILMLAHPRVLGFVFNPLSVFWCFSPQGEVVAVIAEVHNTYHGRHAYVLPATEGSRWSGVAKELYVSPFNDVSGGYRLYLPVPDDTLDLSVVLDRPGRPAFVASVHGEARPVTRRTVVERALRHPVSPLVGALQIRVQAIRLMIRGMRIVRRPGAGQPGSGVPDGSSAPVLLQGGPSTPAATGERTRTHSAPTRSTEAQR